VAEQSSAVASQKFTWPVVTGEVPFTTVAVNVTVLPPFTEPTGLPPEVMDMVVIVPGGAAALEFPDEPEAMQLLGIVSTTVPVSLAQAKRK
jgi:hypothetical protein